MIAFLTSQQPPPAYYTVYPRAADPTGPAQPPAAGAPANAAAGPSKPKKPDNLISRYHLESRTSGTSVSAPPEAAGGKAVWEDTAEKREASLRERKAQMILAARECAYFPLQCSQVLTAYMILLLDDCWLNRRRRRRRQEGRLEDATSSDYLCIRLSWNLEITVGHTIDTSFTSRTCDALIYDMMVTPNRSRDPDCTPTFHATSRQTNDVPKPPSAPCRI